MQSTNTPQWILNTASWYHTFARFIIFNKHYPAHITYRYKYLNMNICDTRKITLASRGGCQLEWWSGHTSRVPYGSGASVRPTSRSGQSAENLPVSTRESRAKLSQPYNGRTINHRSVITISHTSKHKHAPLMQHPIYRWQLSKSYGLTSVSEVIPTMINSQIRPLQSGGQHGLYKAYIYTYQSTITHRVTPRPKGSIGIISNS